MRTKKHDRDRCPYFDEPLKDCYCKACELGLQANDSLTAARNTLAHYQNEPDQSQELEQFIQALHL